MYYRCYSLLHGIGRFIVLSELAAGPFLEPSEYSPPSQTVFLKHIRVQNRTRLYRQ